MSVCYIDVEDEITGAVAALRAATDGRVIMVLPPGSRVATSRINFRLLAREAQERELMLAIVSGEPGVRALAISAGLPAYGSVDDSEAALDQQASDDQAFEERLGAASDQEAGRSVPAERALGGLMTGSVADRAVDAGDGSDEDEDEAPGLWSRVGVDASETSAPPTLPGASPTATSASVRASLKDPRGTLRAPSPPVTVTSREPAAAIESGTRSRSSLRGLSRAGDRGRTPEVPAGATRSTVAGSVERRTDDPPARADSDRRLVEERAARERARVRAGERDALGAEARPHRRRRRWIGVLAALALLIALLGGLAYGALTLLPNATITLRPTTELAGPVTFRVTADAGVAVPDAEAGAIPAQRRELPVEVTGTFPATGTEVTQTRATGTVRFTSENTLFEVPIPEGTVVSTASGIQFETTTSIVMPAASFDTGPTRREAAVRALRAGADGNVPAGAIERVPETIGAALVSVTNPAATGGGVREETPVATREDYDAAVASLGEQLEARLAEVLADPASAPRGLTLFPETAELGRATTEPARDEVVDQRLEEFTLTARAAGSVLAVDEAQVRAIATDRLEGSLTAGDRLFEDSVETTVSAGRIEDDRVVYDVSVQGERYRPLDEAALLGEVRGRKVSEARAILERYGSVEIAPWPEFIDTLPDQVGRIRLTVLDPQRRS